MTARPRTGPGVRITPEAGRVARLAGVTLRPERLASGVGYLSVHRGSEPLGEIWGYGGLTVPGSRWRVLPHNLPAKRRCYCSTQAAAVTALVAAHAAWVAVRPDTPQDLPTMLSDADHIDDLIRHVTLVRNACVLLGRRMMARGEREDGRLLIARGHVHDASKWLGIEWNWLHVGADVPPDKLAIAMEQHVETNDHHPEFHGGIAKMPPLALAEMVCDWYARSQERGTDLRQWITNVAMQKFGFRDGDPTHKQIMGYVNLLIIDPFVKLEE